MNKKALAHPLSLLWKELKKDFADAALILSVAVVVGLVAAALGAPSGVAFIAASAVVIVAPTLMYVTFHKTLV